MADKNQGQRAGRIETVDIKFRADIKEASRNISELERQADRLGDLANQGAHQQAGFLSPKQVEMYRNIVKEVEKTYQKHYQRLKQMQDDYSKRVETSQKDLVKKQEALNRVQGANKWGDVSSPRIIEHHERRLKEAQTEYEKLRGSEAEISRSKQILAELEVERTRALSSASQIGGMHEMNPRTLNAIQGAANTAIAASGVTSLSSLLRYLGNGKDLIREREAMGRALAQKGNYGGTDKENIQAIQETGLKMGYDSVDTVYTQAALIQGGTQNRDKSLKDVQTSQEFGRAYSVNPEELAYGYNVLRRMGTLNEGEMKRFADLIGGAIKANSMSGREEEMLRATTMLLSSVSQGMTELSQGQAGNVLSLQASLGDAIPTLRGEAGAAMLGGIDAAIKAQDPNGDILLGKGTKFTGIEGYYDLEMQKAEGLSNPDNLKTLLSNIKNNFVGEKYQQIVLRDWVNRRGGNMSLPQAKAFMESGLWDQVMNGELQLSDAQLTEFGMASQQEKLEQYTQSDTATRNMNEAERQIRQQNVADGYEDASTWIMKQFNKLPYWAQNTAIFGGGALGTLFGGKIARGVGSLAMKGYKAFKPPIGGGPPQAANWLTRMLKGGGAAADVAGDVTPTATPGTPPTVEPTKPVIYGADGKPITSNPTASAATEVAEDITSAAGKASKLGKLGGFLTKVGGKVLGPLGFVAGADDAANMGGDLFDFIFGHKKGDTYTYKKNLTSHQATYEDSKPGIIKRFGDFLSGADATEQSSGYDGVGKKALHWFFTGERKLPEEQQTGGGRRMRGTLPYAMNGSGYFPSSKDKYDDFIYNMQSMWGIYDDDNAILHQKADTKQKETSKAELKQYTDRIMTPFSEAWKNTLEDFTKKIESTKPKLQSEQTIRVIVEGKVDGLTPENNTSVTKAITSYLFAGKNNSFSTGTFGYTPDIDQTRK